MKITQASYLLRFFDKTSASVYSCNFDIFELQNIYKRNLSPIRIPIFSSELASSFIDSGAGLVLSSYMVRFSCNTVYGKTFEGENFRGFRDFVANRESFPLELFAVYST